MSQPNEKYISSGLIPLNNHQEEESNENSNENEEVNDKNVDVENSSEQKDEIIENVIVENTTKKDEENNKNSTSENPIENMQIDNKIEFNISPIAKENNEKNADNDDKNFLKKKKERPITKEESEPENLEIKKKKIEKTILDYLDQIMVLGSKIRELRNELENLNKEGDKGKGNIDINEGEGRKKNGKSK